MKLRAKNTNSALLCWDPPSEKAGETIGYEIDWSIDHVKQDILNMTQSHYHTISAIYKGIQQFCESDIRETKIMKLKVSR